MQVVSSFPRVSVEVVRENADMGFVDAIKTCLAKFFVFSGRAVRSEYWWFVLFVVVVSVV